MENVRSVWILRNLKWVSRYFNSVKMSGSTSLCRSSVKNVRTSFIFLRASFMPARNCRSFLMSPAKNARIRSHIRRNSPPRCFLRTAGFACSSSLCSAGSGSFAPAQTFFACLSSNRSASPCSPSARMLPVFCSPSVRGTSAALRSSGSSAPSSRSSSPGSPSSGFFPFRVIPKIRSCEENPSSSYAALQLTACKSHVTAIRTVVFSPMLPLT